MIHLTSDNLSISRPTAVAIGKFDGIHRGHMALLKKLKQVAEKKGLASLVFTFNPHPIAFFKNEHMPLLLDPNEKLQIFKSLGIDYYLEYKFDESFAKTSPQDFLQNIVHDKLQAQALVVADGYRFGKGGEGTVEMAGKICDEIGLEMHTIGHVVHAGHKISSDFLRTLIAKRDFELMSSLYGRDFSATGIVVHGNALGRTIGFPTANIKAHPDKLLPPNGVYATTTLVNGITYKSITNIGTRPSIADGSGEVHFETHILNFSDNLYGQEITINFHKHIRDEKKFDSLDELKVQLTKDIYHA